MCRAIIRDYSPAFVDCDNTDNDSFQAYYAEPQQATIVLVKSLLDTVDRTKIRLDKTSCLNFRTNRQILSFGLYARVCARVRVSRTTNEYENLFSELKPVDVMI